MSYPKPTLDQFTPSTTQSAADKRLTTAGVLRFLESGLEPKCLTRRVYLFFTVTLAMSAEYNIDGFKYAHLHDDATRARFLHELRMDVALYAMLDPERGSDVAALFARDFDGPYADLLDPS